MTGVTSNPPGDPGEASPGLSQMIARRDRLLGPAYRLFYRRPLHLVRGEGVWLYDAGGRAYLDAYNNVACVGHCHPEVVAAICRQAATLNTHTRYLHEDILAYAERLLATFPSELGRVMFTCTGSEANDLALRIARSYTGGTGLIVTSLAYHGVTMALAEISPSLRPDAALEAHVRTVPAPNAYHLDGDPSRIFTDCVQAAISSLNSQGMKLAAFMFDTVFSSDGVITHPVGMMTGAVQAVRAAGGLVIADEVQPGFGRTGESFWGFARHGLVPDLVSLGKPMGAGHPIAGLVARPELLAKFGADTRYFNTFGGNPVSIAAANAVLDVIQRDRLQQHARRVGDYLRSRLGELARRHEIMGDIRGVGLFTGVELVTDRHTKAPATEACRNVVNELSERGVLISACAKGANVLKIRPPLLFDESHADFLIAKLDEVLHMTSRS